MNILKDRATKNKIHQILHRNTIALVTLSISTAPNRGFHHEGVCTPTEPAHIPHDMLREVIVQILTWHQMSTPVLHTSA